MIENLHLQRFNKLLVVNRGEIAVRIIRACHELGIGTVAVYSDADRNALHVRYADEAYHIGPSPARESYLVIEKLLDVAKQSGATAVHPGYGFLAERQAFAQACYDAGLVFVGPHPRAIHIMGDKQMARDAVIAAGVPVVPGTEPGLDDEEMIAAAEEIGFPLLVKASAGGGGKGMRPVHDPAELPGALAGARREAESAFGDGRVYLEKLITHARHIEIQVLADSHGNVIHLGERECSLQRRHQKLLEESPSIFVDESLRARMGAVAVAAAKAVDYISAGTVEFLVDREKNFYFLEMNTRLQVEHPVTELVTNVDIVQEMLRIARGRPLKFKQEDVRMEGWAIECRVNAEDPFSNFMPATGRISTLRVPTGPGVRIDTGVYEGAEISPFYDSMISKLICYGKNRAEAIMRMRRALAEYHIMGVQTNIPFHQHIMETPRFLGGTFDTQFVENEFSMKDLDARDEMEAAVIAAIMAHRQGEYLGQMVAPGERDTSNWKWLSRWERLKR
ncbi:MAG: acetyl-CoA carboxylase biotin carboxylase subunit [Ardenticatenaceae bacterium]|nr:acetyl-CoA carboxylase biotin carboxylase subunit [Ardenticatenaceae bacterium]